MIKEQLFEDKKHIVIYIFRILLEDKRYDGCLKIGMTTVDLGGRDPFSVKPNSKILIEAAEKRIKQYSQTISIPYEILHTEVAIFRDKAGKIQHFDDHKVHNVLKRSNIHNKEFKDVKDYGKEWFAVDLQTAINAINAVKRGDASLHPGEITEDRTPIVLRPEQREAVNMAKKQFKRGNKFLWNAKMRFGKTISAHQLIKELKIDKTLILTHRPVVDEGWFEDYQKVFSDDKNFFYGSKKKDKSFSWLMTKHSEGNHVIYFASMQDLRGSETVGGKFDKNNEIFSTAWDLVIVDEAHEGTQTELGKNVLSELTKKNTKVLSLSGTPYNVMPDYKPEEIYSWDYIQEQQAKKNWDLLHFGDPNPYECLPKMNIYTYDLGRLLSDFVDEDVAFNFKEFFRTDDNEEFVHKGDILSFLNLISKTDDKCLYPFSNAQYRDIFRHTLWMLPGVKAALALSRMLKEHVIFSKYTIANVAGEGDEEKALVDAKKLVEESITNDPENAYSITLSCGRLTTGVTIKEWTGVLMLSGGYSTSAASYMQTIFRVQSPCTINGKMKDNAYVFDFAPDRTLNVFSTVTGIKPGRTITDGQRRQLGEFLNFCPIIAIEGAEKNEVEVDRMFEHLKRAYVEKVVMSGFENAYLYDNDKLLNLSSGELTGFEELNGIIGKTKAIGTKSYSVVENDVKTGGYVSEESEGGEGKVVKKFESEEEKQRKKNRMDAISILRGISIRMPLMIYGAHINDDKENEELAIDNFTELVDDASWAEFMPPGVTKEKFKEFEKYYDPEVFALSGKKIRSLTRSADKMVPEARIEQIATIFSTFRNPDKETVLTPWRVVNLHLGDTLGGYSFYDENYQQTITEERYVDRGKITDEVFAPEARLLEINSKSGLYPLYLTYNIYRRRLKDLLSSAETFRDYQKVWDQVVSENIFIVCKTPMARSITERTLVGFRDVRVNAHYWEDLVGKIKQDPRAFVEEVNKLWNAKLNNMKFNAVVGNPPYQEMDGGGSGSSALPLYNKFVDIAKTLKPDYISMIMPSRWMTGGKGLDEFRESFMNDTQVRLIHDYLDTHEVFPNVLIEGGICYFRWERDNNGECTFVSHSTGEVSISERYLAEDSCDVLIRDSNAISILEKTKSDGSFADLVSTRNLFKINDALITDVEKSIKVFGRFNRVRGLMYLSEYESKDPRANAFLGKWKVFISKADGAAGQLGNPIPARIIGDAVLGDCETICTGTFLAIGPFETKEEAKNVIQYSKTKFFRFLVGVRKLKNMTQNTYRFVPLQSFRSSSDIDWEKDIAAIDKQLYKKYDLSSEEIEFIERMIKAM